MKRIKSELKEEFKTSAGREWRLRRCAACVLPGTYPDIVFDSNGVCSYCLSYERVHYRGSEALRNALRPYRRGDSEYDCLVPVSGGRDSAFVLHQLKNVYNLRVLAFNYDNGFLAQEARANLDRMAAALNVDVVVHRSKRDIQCRHLKPLLQLALRKSLKHVLLHLCSGCKTCIWGGAHKVAVERKIPLIVLGESQMEASFYKTQVFGDCQFSLREKVSHSLAMPLNLVRRQYYQYLLRKEFPLHKYEGLVQVLQFYDYVEWDEGKIMTTIQNELNWTSPQDYGFAWRFDCKVHAVVNYLTRAIFGFTEKDELYSKLIREGKLTRKEAIHKLEQEEQGRGAELQVIEQVLDRLTLGPRERDLILSIDVVDGRKREM